MKMTRKVTKPVSFVMNCTPSQNLWKVGYSVSTVKDGHTKPVTMQRSMINILIVISVLKTSYKSDQLTEFTINYKYFKFKLTYVPLFFNPPMFLSIGGPLYQFNVINKYFSSKTTTFFKCS